MFFWTTVQISKFDSDLTNNPYLLKVSAVAQKILLIEDDQFTRELYQDVFKDAGFAMTAAPDGEAGLIKAREGGYDLILLDVMMPKLDGLGFLQGLKAAPAKQPNGPIVLLTNLAHDPIIKEALDNGATAYLVKAELNPDELIAKAKSFL